MFKALPYFVPNITESPVPFSIGGVHIVDKNDEKPKDIETQNCG